MIIIEQVDGWTYAAQAASAPDAAFGGFAGPVAMWRSKIDTGARPGTLPRKRAFRPEDFRGWLGWVIIYEVVREPFDLRFRLFGSSLAESLRADNTGKLFSEAYAHVPGHGVTLRHFRYLARHRMIGMSTGPMNWEGMEFHSGLFLDLPVADDAGDLAYFLTFCRLGDETLSAELPLPRQPLAALAAAV